uniref:Uncharacterized protein n=1 Tax=Arundo donax TaxID=35708 RepID=A0A0A8YRE1_ARUDO
MHALISASLRRFVVSPFVAQFCSLICVAIISTVLKLVNSVEFQKMS